MDYIKKGNWLVRVYNNSDKEIASWVIKDRTEREADKEAMSEVEYNWSGRDWSIVELPGN